MMGGDMWAQLDSVMASAMFPCAIFQQYFPSQLRATSIIYPYIQITFHEYLGDDFEPSKAYKAIERYLAANSSSKAKQLKADMVKRCKSLVFSMDEHKEISNEYQSVKLWWGLSKTVLDRQSISLYLREDDVNRYYTLTFHAQHRELVTGSYLSHVLNKGKVIAAWKRGYLLYGAPGTSKSNMIAAMANLLQYNVYDLELSVVKDNTELGKLLIDNSSKSIIVIEDIDCLLDLTSQRKKKKMMEKDDEKEEDNAMKNVKGEGE
ncbi:hypothetical protein LguiB_006416 [Lonicera macranthoides]